MTTKEKILQLFESGRGIYFSGEEIAQRLEISRAAVWKAVKSLRNDGYLIHAVTNKGYCLSEKTDIISEQGIKKYLEPICNDLDLHIVKTIDSTNKAVKVKASNEEKEGYVLIANSQTEGKGRYGKNFFSPEGSGIYLSLLLRPSGYLAEQAVDITTMAAVAMCEAIEKVSDEKPQIKWVNDIFIKGKKVCGILTEASFGLESGHLEYAVLGLGANVYQPKNKFPKELEKIAGSIFKELKEDAKNRLTASFLNEFMKYYTGKCEKEYIEKYRKYSLVIGKTVTVLKKEEEKTVFVYDIDDSCHLKVKYEDGRTENLSYGEVKIKI